jgi:hypothetical protein
VVRTQREKIKTYPRTEGSLMEARPEEQKRSSPERK